MFEKTLKGRSPGLPHSDRPLDHILDEKKINEFQVGKEACRDVGAGVTIVECYSSVDNLELNEDRAVIPDNCYRYVRHDCFNLDK